MPELNIDFINQGKAQGNVANMLANNGKLDIGRMRPYVGRDGRTYETVWNGGNPKLPTSYSVRPIQANATLRRDEWKTLDDAILDVSRFRLGGIQDLIDKNLVYNLGNAMGTTVLEWHDLSEGMEANMTMDGITRGTGDRIKYQYNYLPIPIIHVDYEINARVLAASRNMSNPIDTTDAERAARRIMEKLEALLFTNVTYSFGEKDSRTNNTIYSYVNHPDRNLIAIGTNWDALPAAGLGLAILSQVLSMKQASINKYHYGPWMLYIPTAYETVIDKDYDTVTPQTSIRERILKISNIQGIKTIDTLPANNVLLVQMTSDNVRLVRGLGLQNIEWAEEGKMVTKYKVITIQVPQVRSDQNKRLGIVHLC
jgi:hypothetical protein